MVVSLKGDILSPKYAPEMMAPAVQASLMPKALPMPNSATPIVATVVHELPESSETSAQMIQALTKKNLGDRIWTP